jgi:hypothetical protein
MGADGGFAGMWTVRAGWCQYAARRPRGNCDDTVSVWRRGNRLYAVAASAGSGGPTAAARNGVQELAGLADMAPGATAGDLAEKLPSGSRASFAIGVFPVRAGQRASIAVRGAGAGIWSLGDGGAPALLLAPGYPGHRAAEVDLLDGDIVCLGVSGLAWSPGGEQFGPLWEDCPDHAGFLRFLETATHATGQDAAAVALWCGRYVIPGHSRQRSGPPGDGW